MNEAEEKHPAEEQHPAEEKKPTRWRRRKARNAWVSLLRRLRKSCQTLEKLEDWDEIVAEVQKLLDDYGDVVPVDNQRRIRKALKLTDATVAGAKQACSVLQTEVKVVVSLLGAGGLVATVAIVALIAVAVGAAVVTIVANATAVDVHVTNQGCRPFRLDQLPVTDALLRLGGIQLPAEPIDDGQTAVVTVPPVTVHINAEDPSAVVFKVAGITLPSRGFQRDAEILFDQTPLTGQQHTFDLGDQDVHELVISCRP
jgi:hypothetical protein